MDQPHSRDERFITLARHWGLDPDEPLRVGGHYLAVVVDGTEAIVSGQVPRLGTEVVVTGAADVVGLEAARRGAALGALRALAALRQALGSLDAVERLLRLGVHVQAGPSFTQHSEVADAASDLLFEVLGEAGRHARTSTGAASLPKNATTEVELHARVRLAA